MQIQTLRDGASGLAGAWSVAVSPDGFDAYVASRYDDSVAMFARDPLGGWHYIGKLTDGVDGVDGLDGANDVAIAPDGLTVYVTSDGDDAIAVFDRNPYSGLLTFVAALRNGDLGVDAMTDPSAVAVASSGRVFVTSFTDAALLAFDPIFGGLAPVGAWVNGQGGVTGLAGARDVATADTPSGVAVYVASQYDAALAVFTEQIFPLPGFAERQVLQDGVGGVDGLASAQAVAVSPDRSRVYAAGAGDTAISAFSRNSVSGLLTYEGLGQNPSNGQTFHVSGLDSLATSESNLYAGGGFQLLFNWIPEIAWFHLDDFDGSLDFDDALQLPAIGGFAIEKKSIAATPDDAQVLMADSFYQTLYVYGRDGTTGALTPVQELPQASGAVGIEGAQGVVVSPDGANVYVLGGDEAIVTELARDTATGELSYVGASRPSGGFVEIVPPYRNETMSPDGKNLYVFDYRAHRITVYRRDVTPGHLFPAQQIVSNTPEFPQYLQFEAGSVSPDGTRVFVTSFLQNAISVFARDPATGALAHLATHDENELHLGMTGPQAVIAGPNAVYVGGSANLPMPIELHFGGAGEYVGATSYPSPGENCNAISMALSPDRAMLVTGQHGNHVCAIAVGPTGGLAYRSSAYVPNVQGYVHSAAVSPSGQRVYATLYDGNHPNVGHSTLAVFSLDPSGTVALLETHSDADPGVDDTQGLVSVAVSPDGKNVYGAAFIDDAVVAFAPEPRASLAIGAAIVALAILRARSVASGQRDPRSSQPTSRSTSAGAPKTRPSLPPSG